MDLAGLQRAADENFVASFRKLVEHSPTGEQRELGSVVAFTSGLPIGLFNGCVVIETADAGDLDAAIRWLIGTGLPFRIWIREELAAPLRAVPLQHGFADERRYPGMAVAPIPDTGPDPAPGVAVHEVVDEHGLEVQRGILVAAGADATVVQRLLPASFLADPDVTLFTAFLDGRPVGHSLAIRSGDVSGVYNVGTIPSARRRGVGTAATRAAIGAGRRWGCEAAVLQSTDMGQSIYEAIGLRTVVQYAEFRAIN